MLSGVPPPRGRPAPSQRRAGAPHGSTPLRSLHCRQAVLAGQNVFLTGVGGAGKSYLIQHLQDHFEQAGTSYAVAAMTGCAAHLLGGTTLHRVLSKRCGSAGFLAVCGCVWSFHGRWGMAHETWAHRALVPSPGSTMPAPGRCRVAAHQQGGRLLHRGQAPEIPGGAAGAETSTGTLRERICLVTVWKGARRLPDSAQL